MGDVAPGDGLRQWHDLLAPAADWQQAGVWKAVHCMLLDHLRGANQLDFNRAVVDSATVRAVGGAKKQVPALWIGENQAPSIMC